MKSSLFRRAHFFIFAVIILLGTYAVAAPVQNGDLTTSDRGVWGEIEYSPLLIEPSDYLLRPRRLNEINYEATVWRFPGLTRPGVAKIFRDSGMGEAEMRRLLESSLSRVTDTGIEIRPPDDLVMNMTPVQRARLYSFVGGGIPGNFYDNPHFFDYRGFPSIAVNSGLSQQTVDLISSLSYKKFGPYLFSDVSLVMRQVKDEKERNAIYRIINRERSLSIKLKITDKDDIQLLARYWGANGRNQGVIPILKSASSNPAVNELDVVHLLPPTPRKLANSYASLSMAVGTVFPDCYWTAFNFFNDEPSDRYLDPAACDRVVRNRYERAVKPWRLGDLVIISDSNGRWLHSCNYIAGNIVFTKNGMDILRPWVFDDIDSVLRNYLYTEKTVARFYRLKPEYQN